MKAVIAVPSIRDFYFTPSRASALGAVSLQKTLSRYGVNAELFNFPARTRKSIKLPLPDELDYLNPLILPDESGPVSFFTGYRLFGPPAQTCAMQLIETGADIVLISCFAWAYAGDSLELSSRIKKLNPGIKTAVGGAGATVNPEYFRSSGLFDYILPGTAEDIIPAFLKNEYGLKLPGENTAKHDTPPFVWAETGISKSKEKRFISAMLTRGCPKNCRFCANHLVHGKKFRKASLEEIREEIAAIPEGYSLHINFEDDNLLLDKNFLFNVIDIVKSKFPASTFTAENGLDYTMMDPDTVKALINSGFIAFNLSMASSSRELLHEERRYSDIERLRSVIKTAARAEIPSVTYFICGLENDSGDSVLENIITLHRLPTLTGISMFYPVPGLPGFSPEILSLKPPRLCAGSSAYPWTGSLSTKQLVTAFRLSRLSNLIKTRQEKILPGEGRQAGTDSIEKLVEKTFETGRLHTLAGGRLIPVPVQDERLVSGFLAAASID